MNYSRIVSIQMLIVCANSFITKTQLLHGRQKMMSDDYLSSLTHKTFIATTPRKVSGDYLSSLGVEDKTFIATTPRKVSGDYLSSLGVEDKTFIATIPRKVSGDYLSSLGVEDKPFIATIPRKVSGDYLSSLGVEDKTFNFVAQKKAPDSTPNITMNYSYIPLTKELIRNMSLTRILSRHPSSRIPINNDYLSSLSPIRSNYQAGTIAKIPTHIYAMEYINKEIKHAQDALFDSIEYLTEEFILKTISLLNSGGT